MLALFVATIDDPLGRFNPSMLTDQARMEMLVASRKETTANQDYFLKFTTDDGDYLDACDWPCVACDDAQNVTSINWKLQKWVDGPVTLDYLPENLEYMDIICRLFETAKASGTITTSLLPRVLQYLAVSGQNFFGTLDLSALPPAMTHFYGIYNKFAGTIDLEHLPPKMEIIDLSGNKLSGTLSLTKIQASMRRLILDSNEFSGTIELESLPAGMEVLDLHANELSGRPSMENIPKSLTAIVLHDNNFDDGFGN